MKKDTDEDHDDEDEDRGREKEKKKKATKKDNTRSNYVSPYKLDKSHPYKGKFKPYKAGGTLL